MSITKDDLKQFGKELSDSILKKTGDMFDKRFEALDIRIDKKFKEQDDRIDEKFREQDDRINQKFKENNKTLIQMMFEHFLTKDEGVSKKYLEKQLQPIKNDTNILKDDVAYIKYRLDEAEIPWIVKAVDKNKVQIEKLKKYVGYSLDD